MAGFGGGGRGVEGMMGVGRKEGGREVDLEGGTGRPAF